MNSNFITSVTTLGRIFAAQIRITNSIYMAQFAVKTNAIFNEFAKNFTDELLKNFDAVSMAMYKAGKMRVEVTDLNGSVVDFNIITDVAENFTTSNVSQIFTDALNKSTTFAVDPSSYSFRVQNACGTGVIPCSQDATCTSDNGVASCKCNTGFNDTSPSSPGQICIDINECSGGTNNCSSLASCTNTIGSYQCQCYPGITDGNSSNPGRQCIVVPTPTSTSVTSKVIVDYSWKTTTIVMGVLLGVALLLAVLALVNTSLSVDNSTQLEETRCKTSICTKRKTRQCLKKAPMARTTKTKIALKL
ncbi:hypothetical protein XELAEV_18014364mg [Xenopus laevis]|uniref:EGF-like domain-containing protein n=1 Tax=Xenopus laevis TaxID=8355 RepID=A0A974DGM9_XENLA|nr:hypothetical protein XELAEV_18014364mg [Xenopus laevis]